MRPGQRVAEQSVETCVTVAKEVVVMAQLKSRNLCRLC